MPTLRTLSRYCRPRLIPAVSFCFFSFHSFTQPLTKQQYIEQYSGIAVREMHRAGIPASITLAQGILESGSGNSDLARRANNHFGIKCHNNWNGPSYYQDDDEKHECFRKYPDPEESYRDHSDFLRSRERYAILFDLPRTDYKSWAHGLKQAGYATNPAYAEQLIRIIDDNGLHIYDTASPKPKAMPSGSVFEYNRIKTVLAGSGDTPLGLAKKYDIPYRKLLGYNNLDRSDTLRTGDRVYLQPRRRKNYDERYHYMREGETMKDVSREYGVLLRLLYSRNLLAPPDEPAAGEKIHLNKKRKTPPKLRNTEEPVPDGAVQPQPQYYVVQQGDTLYSISKKFNVFVHHLKKWNNLPGDEIKPGDRLRVTE